MTHQEDIAAYLKAKIEDRSPKCGNCKKGCADPSAIAIDTLAPLTTWLTCKMTSQPVPDLSLCSAWEKRDQ